MGKSEAGHGWWQSRRNRVLLAGGGAVAVVAVVALVVTLGGDPPSAGPTPNAGPPSVAEQGGVSADAGAEEAEVLLASMPPTAVRYTFDTGPGRAVRDSDGQHSLRPVVDAGGEIDFTRRGDGYAVQFPARCRRSADKCPRAILESSRADVFNPGARPIRYGAAVQLTADETGPGANVLQKGFSVGGGSQFKLQVDGAAGRPSCVLSSGRDIYRLTSKVGVADGRWHRITCTRIGGRLSIDVDGRAVSRRIPEALSIRNDEPLRVGGKGAGPNNDQFAGRIDDVFVNLY
jgi:hypothetical protein